MEHHTIVTLSIILAYAVGVMIIGFIAYYYTHSLSDYVLGGRRLAAPVVALGACASDMSSWLTIALPGLAYVTGVKALWLPLGLWLGSYYNWRFIAMRLRVYTEILDDALTIPDYLVRRFVDGKGVLRSLTAVIIVVFFTFYASSGFVAASILLQSVFHNSYSTGLYIITAVFIVYTCFGGFLGISYVDFIQGVLVFLFLLALPCFALYSLGGWHGSVHAIESHRPLALQLFHDWKFISVISLLAWGLGYMGQPHILVRFMAIRRPSRIVLARWIALSWMLVAMVGSVAAGILGNGFSHAEHFNVQLILVALTKILSSSEGIVGLVVAIMLSVGMSAIAAQLLVASSAVIEDLYRVYWRRKAQKTELLWTSRLAVTLIALVAMYLAHDPNSSVLALVAYAWSGLGASFGPIVLFSLRWKRTTRAGAVAGLFVGAITVIVWSVLKHAYGGFFDLYELIPGFILSSLAIWLVSLYTQPPEPEVQEAFDKMLAALP